MESVEELFREFEGTNVSPVIEFTNVVESLYDLHTTRNSSQAIVIAQSPNSGKSVLLQSFGQRVPLIIIPCYYNRVLVHFRESIEQHRMKLDVTHNDISSPLLFQRQLEHHAAVHHKIRAFLLSYVQFTSHFMDLFTLRTLTDAATQFPQHSSTSLLQLFYHIVMHEKAAPVLIRMFNEFTASPVTTLKQKLHSMLNQLKFPVLAIDDAHLIFRQATGLLFHNNYKDHMDHSKRDFLRCMEHETRHGTCLSHELLDNPELHYKYPTDVLYGVVNELQELQSQYSSNGFRFMLSTSDLRLLSIYPCLTPFHNLPYNDLNKISSILLQRSRSQTPSILFTGRIGLIMNSLSAISQGNTEGSIQSILENMFQSLCKSLKLFPSSYEENLSDRERLEKIIGMVYNAWLLQGKKMEDKNLVSLLVRSGIGLWTGGNQISLAEPIIGSFIDYLCDKLSASKDHILDQQKYEMMKEAFSKDANFHDVNSELFHSLVVQSVTSQIYHRYNQQSIQKLITEWDLNEKLFPCKTEELRIQFTRAGTLEDFDLQRTDYFTSNTEQLYDCVLSYLIPSDFPSLRSVAVQVKENGKRSLCFLWVFVKTTSKYLCTGEFISAMNSLSLHRFIPRKLSDRHQLLENYVEAVSSFDEVFHIRIFLCSSGFSNVHSRSVDRFNEEHPEQPIFLVHSNKAALKVQQNIYGKELLTALKNSVGALEFFSVRTEKVTHSTIDLSDFIIPNNLLYRENAPPNSRALKLKDHPIVQPQGKSQSRKRIRKPSNPVHIPKRFRLE